MDAQSPSKRFTRGIPLHVENSVERPSFSLGLTQDFREVSGSMSKSNTMQEIKSKLKNNPIRLEGMSAKSKQSNIKIVEGGKKDQPAAGSSKKGKKKQLIIQKRMQKERKLLFLAYWSMMRCHVQAQLIRCMFLREIEGSSKDAILIHVNGTTLRFTIRDFAIISGLKCSDNKKDFVFNTEEPNRIILQYFGVEKAITKSQLVEKFDNKVWGDNDDDAVKFAILFYIHSFILSEEPTSTVIDRKDFDLVESGRYIDYPWGKKAFDLLILHLHTKIKHDGKSFKLILNWKTKKDFPRLSYFAKGMFRDDNNPVRTQVTDFSISRDEFDQFKLSKVVRVSAPSSTPEVSIHQSNLHSPAGQSAFRPLVHQFNNLEPQGHNNSGVPINFKVQNNSEKENCEDVPIEVVKEGSQFMDDQRDFNNSSFQDLLNVIHDQTEKMEKEEFTDTNKAGSSNVNELVVEEVLMCPAPLQMVHDDQPNINPERSMVLYPLLAVDEHTPLPIHRERRPGPFNTSPYVTSFGSESGSSSRFHFSFDLKHPFVAMSDLERMAKKSDTKRTIQNKNWFYRLAYKNQLFDDSHVDVILYYIRKRAKYSDTNAFSFITVDCNFSNLITNVWDAYYNFESNINKESTEESIIEYINGYKMHVARPWHIVDNILIPVNIYDSLRGGALHDSSVENEIKKYALISIYLSKSDFYGKKGIEISSHPKYKSHSECDSFEMIYVNDIPQQDARSLDCGLYVAAYTDHISNGNGVPNSFDSEFTRIQYASLLWNYGVPSRCH
ncbi:hypothetical protein KY289_026067 [Solanum tuberosum]|nr:hypothetical protein KY289_026067 [Solanum tuberosum]